LEGAVCFRFCHTNASEPVHALFPQVGHGLHVQVDLDGTPRLGGGRAVVPHVVSRCSPQMQPDSLGGKIRVVQRSQLRQEAMEVIRWTLVSGRAVRGVAGAWVCFVAGVGYQMAV